jgi:hypothetical protein
MNSRDNEAPIKRPKGTGRLSVEQLRQLLTFLPQIEVMREEHSTLA